MVGGNLFREMYLARLVMLLTGIALGFLGKWWGKGWIWLVLVLLFIEFFVMSSMATRRFTQLRKAVGLPYFEGTKLQPAVSPTSSDEITALIAAFKPIPIAVVGFGGLMLIMWLILFKPFCNNC